MNHGLSMGSADNAGLDQGRRHALKSAMATDK